MITAMTIWHDSAMRRNEASALLNQGNVAMHEGDLVLCKEALQRIQRFRRLHPKAGEELVSTDQALSQYLARQEVVAELERALRALPANPSTVEFIWLGEQLREARATRPDCEGLLRVEEKLKYATVESFRKLAQSGASQKRLSDQAALLPQELVWQEGLQRLLLPQ